jgi:L-threonylcarbamoyladenylate synthase
MEHWVLDSPGIFPRAVARAHEFLAAGELVAIPTETVYGLAANALNPEAVQKIFEVKGRPARNPLIVHVGSLAMARQCVETWPPLAADLARAFWPGPLTLVLARTEAIPPAVTAGGKTVGIRWPRHPFVQALIDRCDFPLAAPSANLSGSVSPTRGEHVQKMLRGKIPLLIDGGPCVHGIESTVLDLTANPPRLLRPGAVGQESLLTVLPEMAIGFGDAEEVLKSPGMLDRHYAPSTPLSLARWEGDQELKAKLADLGKTAGETVVLIHSAILPHQSFRDVRVMPHDPEAYARALYAELHRADELGARLILVEAPPEGGEWAAVKDRLRRAAFPAS